MVVHCARRGVLPEQRNGVLIYLSKCSLLARCRRWSEGGRNRGGRAVRKLSQNRGGLGSDLAVERFLW